MKVALILAGFAPRSFRYTHASVSRSILAPLRLAGHDVAVYHFSFLSKKKYIDTVSRQDDEGCRLNMDDVYLLKESVVATEVQEDKDEELRRHPFAQKLRVTQCNPGPIIGRAPYHFQTRLNAARILYQEKRAIELVKNKPDVCVFSYNELLYLDKLDPKDVDRVVANPKLVLVSDNGYSYSGLEDGFYITSWDNAVKIGTRFDSYVGVNRPLGNYEWELKSTVSGLGLQVAHTRLRKVKVRAGGIIRSTGHRFKKLYSIYTTDGRLDVKKCV